MQLERILHARTAMKSVQVNNVKQGYNHIMVKPSINAINQCVGSIISQNWITTNPQSLHSFKDIVS